MPSTSISGYLATAADGDLFGLLTVYCFVTAILGLFEKVSNTTPYQLMAFLGLLAIISKQGSLEYWWDWIWNPFWQHASDEVRMAYLKQHGASDEWIEYLAEPANGSD